MAHNILLADNRIDSSKIGISGISWGGVVTALAMGYDNRYAFGIPIYGSGYLEQSHSYFDELFSKPDAKNLWSVADRFSEIKFPTLWLAWANDQAFSINTNSLSYDALKSAGGVLSIKQNWNHSHTQGYEAEESYRFADSVCRGGEALITCVTEPAGRKFSFTIDTGGESSVTARAYYITQKLFYSVRPGNTIPTIDQTWKKVDCAINGNTVTGVLPAVAVNYYVEITVKTTEGSFITITRLTDVND